MKGLTVSFWIVVCFVVLVAKAQNFPYKPNNDSAARNSCYTKRGQIGTCISLRSCYTELKLSSLANPNFLATSTVSTCHYVETNGSKQVYGVCCPSRLASKSNIDPAVVIDGLDRKDSEAAVYPEAESFIFDKPRLYCGIGPFASWAITLRNATKNSWPGIVSLKKNGRHFCGGSLMSPIHVLTAAHCVAHMTSLDVSRLTVELGIHVLEPTSDAPVSKKIYCVAFHSGFDSKTLYNDIAILTMESPVIFTDKISPFCFPPQGSNDQYTGKYATVLGWGAPKKGVPTVLQQVAVQFISNARCESSYGSDAPGGIVDHMLCAAYPGKDSCNGDSGGPLLVQSFPGYQWTQAGIVSWCKCAQAKCFGVSTRVTSFMKWIIKHSRVDLKQGNHDQKF